LDLLLLLGANRELARPSSGITHGEDPDPVASAPAALPATAAIENPAIEQGTA